MNHPSGLQYAYSQRTPQGYTDYHQVTLQAPRGGFAVGTKFSRVSLDHHTGELLAIADGREYYLGRYHVISIPEHPTGRGRQSVRPASQFPF
jgi:hypothetical protein